MNIDWNAPAAVDESTIRILSQGSHVTQAGQGGPIATDNLKFGPDEDPDGARYIGPGPSAMPRSMSVEERVERLEAGIQSRAEAMPADRRPDEDLVRKLVAGARSGLAKIENGQATNVTLAEAEGLEAVIDEDGTRPSLIVQDGFVDLGRGRGKDKVHIWRDQLQAAKKGLEKVITAVGAIRAGNSLKGTGFVIAPGHIVTNRHVLIDSMKADPELENTIIEFDVGQRFNIREVLYVGPQEIDSDLDLRNLDLAVLRVDPGSEAGFPELVRFAASSNAVQVKSTLCVIGFPARPKDRGPVHATIIADLFGDRFGVKRLAPGEVDLAIGTHRDDTQKWVFVHDATTLGGSSGSCVIDLASHNTPVIGIHFGGYSSRKENYAHAAAALQERLIAQGATFV